jgi:hypothetical protein
MIYDEQPDLEREALLSEMSRTRRAQRRRSPMETASAVAPPLEVPAGEAPAAPYQAQGPALGLEGFDTGKLSSGHVSPKYVFAKHAQGLGVNDRDELLRRLQADESGYFKNASWGGNKGDILKIGGELDPKFEGISEFDVIRAMGEGGKGWQWSGVGPSAAPQRPMGPSTFAGPSSFSGIQQLMPTDTDFYNQLQSKLVEILGGSQNLDRQALLDLLRR